jgi:glutathione synthase/RimK-type ligase-like ATP-grasp enzyme
MRNTILLWGVSGDPPLMALLAELEARALPHRFLDQRWMHQARFDFSPDGMTGTLSMAERDVELAAISALYARPNDLCAVMRRSGEIAANLEAQRSALATERRLYAWAEMTPALVVNRPSAASANDSKPYQLEQIHAAGFTVPPTLITTSPQAAREFVAQHGQVVCKSAGRTRSIVSRLESADLERLDAVTHCPTLFQAYIAGRDWRVHCVGSAIHACEIHCAADDYRVAAEHGVALEIVPAELPEAIAARCRSLTRALGLELAGIDLRRSGDAWYCFEVNPSPLFTYFEQAAGQPLTAAIAELLSDATCRGLN